ncbi:unnamed protein product [Clonostachys rosea]|uniref:Heterokaryon incompatibility domain-containing protein n=1 Tax=Bionectria ochroleuca TaxID=29856 RepID=A0ABY6US83_BIOOC|nr:unnamed protein product [Clonostachys rosea]
MAQEFDATSFEVLSYAREKSEPTSAIHIDQEVLLVPANVEAALRGLRHHDEPRCLWVDFICIDQRSISERSFHIRFMKTILRKCSRVLVWLGPNPTPAGERPTPTEEDLGKGLKLIEAICNKHASLLHDLELEGAQYRQKRAGGTSDVELKANDGLPPMRLLTQEQQQDFENALQIPTVWKDVWITRDICLAPQVYLVVGFHALDWARIEDFLGEDSYAETIYGRFYHGTADSVIGHMITMVLRIDQQRRTMRNVLVGSEKQSLLGVMGQFRFVKTADPRDLIYSMITLATDMDDLKVDCGDSTGKLFSKLTELLINRDGNLNLISQSPWRSFQAPTFDVGYGYHLSDLIGEKPSWAANFQKSLHGRLFIHGCPFQAGWPSCEVPCRVIDGKTLVAKGVKLGRVGKIKASDYHDQTKLNWIEPGPRFMKRDNLPMEYLDLYLGRGVLTESDAGNT